MESPDASIAIALKRARENVQKLEQIEAPTSGSEAWSNIILENLAFHRAQRTYWRSLVNDLPAYLKEQVLAEDLGGQFEASADVNERHPAIARKAVRLPPPTPEALAALRPTATPAAAELRKSRAAAAASPDIEESPGSTSSDGAFATPEPRTSAHTGLGLSTPGFVSASKDPLRSARASPAQLPQGGLNELQAALAKRRGGQS